MFTKSLDGKPLYMNEDGVEMIDIMQGMYNGLYDFSLIHSVYRANTKCTMRPDYLAACLYGDEAYAEIAMKSAMLFNPFALEKGDTVYAMTIDNIYHNIKESILGPGGDSFYEMVKNYHKYIDPDKVPEADGSEPNKVIAKKQLKKWTVFLVEIRKLMTNKTSAGTKDCWYHLWSYDTYTPWENS